MSRQPEPLLNRRQKYLQLAFNSTLEDAQRIISRLPASDRIILEAGTPLIKRYGVDAIRQLRGYYQQRLGVAAITAELPAWAKMFLNTPSVQIVAREERGSRQSAKRSEAYIVADLKTMDRAATEVEMVASAGASAAIALGSAPIETLNAFVESCAAAGLDAMIDMMNVEYPLAVLAALKKLPALVIIHRGVDEERLNKEKQIPYYEIQRIKGRYNIMIAIAGGDTLREVQRSVFNGADVVVVWKSVYQANDETIDLVNGFLKEIK